jgi:octanoyl-[GcvH]:protein N-octanoyltransferase
VKVELARGRLHGEPALELALAATLLRTVAAGERGPILRVYRPRATVAFGRRDAFLPGFSRACASARQRGFTPILRAQGGRAAAYDSGCLIFDQAMPSNDSLLGIEERFELDAERYARALQSLGVDARVGEVRGEYCPGAFTVNARGERKLVGAAQRLVRGGWLLSTVIVAEGSDRLREVLDDVYGALELDWDPSTVGSVADEAPGVGMGGLEEALLRSYRDRYRLVDATVAEHELAAATGQLERFRVP